MSRLLRTLTAAMLCLPWAAVAAPESSARPVIACETLVGLRLLMTEGGDHEAALARLGRHPACRLVARERVGEAEQRAMIGGAPFECLVLRDEGLCAWVMP